MKWILWFFWVHMNFFTSFCFEILVFDIFPIYQCSFVLSPGNFLRIMCNLVTKTQKIALIKVVKKCKCEEIRVWTGARAN